MAEEPKKAEKKSGGGGGNKLLVIVIILLVVVLAAVGGLAAFVLTHSGKGGADGHGDKTAEAKPKKKHDGPPIFEKMEAFVVNLSGTTNAMLQVDMQAEMGDEAARQKFKDYMPKIRSAVILLLSSKTPTELATPEGKVRLRAQIKKIINESMDAGPDEAPVDSIVFTSFIIQQQ